MKNSNQPIILSNIPKGKDLFKSRSHRNIADTIITLIEDKNKTLVKQIVGLEGNWGTGKSNIIKIIEEETKDKHLHFTYDAWTNQEDLSKSNIIEELYYFLKISSLIQDDKKINNDKSETWRDLKDSLSKKTSYSNTKSFPKIKGYWVFGLLSVFTYTFFSFIFNEFLKTDLSSKYYFIGGETYKRFWIVSLVPLILIILSVFHFLKEYFKTNKTFLDLNLLGEMIYWVSGEKLENNSTNEIIENVPENIEFKKFIYAIDKELGENKKLIFTIDNIDRLPKEKVKILWSTVNIFFAESNTPIFLKNIWLLIPYDEKKVTNSFDDPDAGIGLIEKTFAITFKVPPPLLSNWETFFEDCFNESFGENIIIENRDEEIQILKRIFEHYENDITPRKIINYINQIASYYIQNNSIQLRYNALFVLNKDRLFKGSINENIINRDIYLGSLKNMFVNDEKLEINISKIIYGVNSDEEAEEAMLLKEIDNILKGTKGFNENLINIPSFDAYFIKVFKKFILNSSGVVDDINSSFFKNISEVLEKVKVSFYEKNHPNIYRSLWEDYSKLLLSNSFDSIENTHKKILEYCNKETSKNLIENTITNLWRKAQKDSNNLMSSEDDEIFKETNYIDNLEIIFKHFSENTGYSIDEISVKELKVKPVVFLNLVSRNPKQYQKYKLLINSNELCNFFITRENELEVLNVKDIESFSNELLILNGDYDLRNLLGSINRHYKNNAFLNNEELNTVIFLAKEIGKKHNLKFLTDLDSVTSNSIVEIIADNMNTKGKELSDLYLLLLRNFNIDYSKISASKLIRILKNENKDLYDETYKNIFLSLDDEDLVKVLDIPTMSSDRNLSYINFVLEQFLMKSNIKLSNDNFNWILEEFSNLNEHYSEKINSNIINFINTNYSKYQINIKTIDIELLDNLEIENKNNLISKANNYLKSNIINMSSLFLDKTTQEYKLVHKLAFNDSLNKEVIDNLLIPISNLYKNNSPVSKDLFQLLLIIKSQIDKTELLNLIQSFANNGIATHRNFAYFFPEAFQILDSLNPVNRKNRVVNNYLLNSEFYVPELVDFLLKENNQGWINSFRQRININTNQNVLEYAREKGVI